MRDRRGKSSKHPVGKILFEVKQAHHADGSSIKVLQQEGGMGPQELLQAMMLPHLLTFLPRSASKLSCLVSLAVLPGALLSLW